MSNSNINTETKRLQAENDLLTTLPNDLGLALAQAGVLSAGRVDNVKKLLSQSLTTEEIVAHEVAWLDTMAQSFDLDRESVSWIHSSVFMAEFSRWIRKRAGDKHGNMPVDTAAAVYNPRTEEVEIIFNPKFMTRIASKERVSNNVNPNYAGVNEHEHFHLLFQHITGRRREPHSLWNIATDLAINSLISRCDTPARLPGMLLLPGLMNKGPVDKSQPKEVQEAREKLGKIIAKLPAEQASEWYFNKLKQESEKQGYSWGKEGLKIPGKPNPDGEDGEWVLWPSDQHGGWDDIPEELRDIVEGKIRHAMRKASDAADNTDHGWGNIPQELREEIRAYAHGRVDWKAVLKNWAGMRTPGGRSRSIKRIDRRFPNIHPGLKRQRNPTILVMVDQSDSVDDTQLARIYGALEGCSKHITFDVVPFDHTVADKDKFTWLRGTRPALKRVRGGGTSFDAAVEYANRPELRGKYDGMIICTDGECSQPPPSRTKLAWLITPGHKLHFAARSGEILIQMSEKDNEKAKMQY